MADPLQCTTDTDPRLLLSDSCCRTSRISLQAFVQFSGWPYIEITWKPKTGVNMNGTRPFVNNKHQEKYIIVSCYVSYLTTDWFKTLPNNSFLAHQRLQRSPIYFSAILLISTDLLHQTRILFAVHVDSAKQQMMQKEISKNFSG